jgi:lipid II:glycine glycyltransferase (peptidoglycan interpeptide bridge formation enzyme)
MLEISYNIKGLHLVELWFSSNVPLERFSLLKLCCYRDIRVNRDTFGLKKEEKYTLVHDLTLSQDSLFSTFKPNVRNEIRKHEKINNFFYHANFNSKLLFLNFYKKFAEAKKLPHLQEHSIAKYKDNLFYVHGTLEGKLTNLQVYLVDKESGIVRLLHSISTLYEESDKQKKAKIGWINRYLHWYTMLYFKAENFKIFDWGGFSNNPNSSLAGIDKFKASFGGEQIKLYDYYTLPYYSMKLLQERIL